ncbi:hypothetical protein LRS06_17350 [Hymenobacter sp. J193]|uniref:hypothetical protein n=1 Tax=Hymenobacter sp. J193 TaxID=2898429 RepID=UPI002151AD5E|nr:hypothetical protein [Hymenobacter sp. J193]MCR5889505.1 hypothetical protein [Hymenobacter sp. J193]
MLSRYSLFGLWPLLYRWKSWLLGAGLLALVVSAVVSLLLPNEYASTAVFIPSNPEAIDPDRTLAEGGRLDPGARAEDIDRVLTIGQSQPVAEELIRRFDLYKHYKAGKPGNDEADNYVLYEFMSNLSLVHNERDAIELTFLDTDKQLAARLANAMVGLIDSINQQLTVENRRKVLDLQRTRYTYLNKSFQTTQQEILKARRHYGIYGLEEESRYLAREVIRVEAALRQAEGSGATAATVAGLRRALRGLTEAKTGNRFNLESYAQGLDSVQMLEIRMKDLANRMATARGEYESADIALKSRISSLYIVQPALPATRKARPIRWLIVLGSVAVTLGLSVVLIGVLEWYRAPQPLAQAA